jgi:hypothetical protein
MLHGDVVQLARYLLRVPAVARADASQRAFDEAQVADTYRITRKRRHPHFGDGSLSSWAMRERLPTEPFLDDPDYVACLVLVLTTWQAQLQPDAQDTQRRAVKSSFKRPAGIASPQSSHSP